MYFLRMNVRHNRKNTRELISEMKRMLHEPKLTMENMIFSELDDKDTEPNNEMTPNDGNSKNNMADNSNNTNEETKDFSAHDAISQIRKISLRAVAQLADNPTSPEYELFKKIWNICDKGVENGQNKKHNNDEE